MKKLIIEAGTVEALAGYIDFIKQMLLEGYVSGPYPTKWNLSEVDPDVVNVELGISDIDEIGSFLKNHADSEYLQGLGKELLKLI